MEPLDWTRCAEGMRVAPQRDGALERWAELESKGLETQDELRARFLRVDARHTEKQHEWKLAAAAKLLAWLTQFWWSK